MKHEARTFFHGFRARDGNYVSMWMQLEYNFNLY